VVRDVMAVLLVMYLLGMYFSELCAFYEISNSTV